MRNVMKKLRIIPLVVAVLLSLASAQSLPALTPPGAVGGFYSRNLAVKKAYFVDFQAEWNRLGISDLFMDFVTSEGELDEQEIEDIRRMFSVDLIGREGIATIYPDGEVFLMARPSASQTGEIINLFKSDMESPKQVNGWLIETDEEAGIVYGVSSDAVFLASPGAADRFLAGDRGLKLPVSGDLAIWFEAAPLWTYLDDPNLGLPPDAIRAIKTFIGFSAAASLELDGVHSKGSFCLDPKQDAELASIFLTNETAWRLDDLPAGVNVSTGVLDIPKLGQYLNDWAVKFGNDLGLDLSSFGKRFALIDAGSDDPQEALQNPLGNVLLLLETTDSLTAEVTLLSWLQMAAAFSTPEGQGGFSVEPITVNGRDGKAIQLGMAGTIYLVSYDDRLAIATSEKALELLSAPRLGSNPGYAKLAGILPADYLGASYGDNKKSLEQVAQMMPLMMMQTIDDAETQQFMSELSVRLSQFFDFVADRMGGSISFTKQTGSCLSNAGFTEVKW